MKNNKKIFWNLKSKIYTFVSKLYKLIFSLIKYYLKIKNLFKLWTFILKIIIYTLNVLSDLIKTVLDLDLIFTCLFEFYILYINSICKYILDLNTWFKTLFKDFNHKLNQRFESKNETIKQNQSKIEIKKEKFLEFNSNTLNKKLEHLPKEDYNIWQDHKIYILLLVSCIGTCIIGVHYNLI